MQLERRTSQDEMMRTLQAQVDELTRTNLVLKEQLARKEQLTALIAHELRSPLAPIINYAQLIARPNTRPELQQKGTAIIVGQAQRLTRLVNDLLDTSLLNSGQFTLIRAHIDITALAREAVEQVRPVAPYHTFVVDVPETPIISYWDSGRIQQALGNLLDNAIKYSDERTTITVRITQPDEKTVRVSVHNIGTQIPNNEVGQLFRPYVRLQASGGQQGSGLGLHITKSIIEAHGGTLRLEKPEPEQNDTGTTFSFDLPLDRDLSAAV